MHIYVYEKQIQHAICFQEKDILQLFPELLFRSPEHKVLKVSFCAGPLSIVRACVRTSTISLNNISSEPTYWIWPNFTGMFPGWSPTKVVQIVPVGCLSRSRGQKIGFQNAILKNLLVWNYNAQSFHIKYIASSRDPLPKLFKLCPWDQNWLRPGGHNFTLNYIRTTANVFFSWTASGWIFDKGTLCVRGSPEHVFWCF